VTSNYLKANIHMKSA